MENKDLKVVNGVIYYNTEVQVYAGRYFVGYCGSKAAYDDDYDDVEYEVKISFDDFSDWFVEQDSYLNSLKERNAELYHKYFDEDDTWAFYDPSDSDIEELLQDCIDNYKDRYDIAEFYNWAGDIAQEEYDNEIH